MFISNFMTSKTGEKCNAMLKMLNISRTKGIQTMKFSQLTKYNIRYIFFEKS